MFCYQCQETAEGKGCRKVGVCGKDKRLSLELDALIFETVELAALNNRLREYKLDNLEASRMITDALFTSITNANFDHESVCNKARLVRNKKNILKEIAHRQSISLNDLHLSFLPPIFEQTSVLCEKDEDIRSLKQLIIYGLKGVSAYAKHAQRLGFEDALIYASIEDTLSQIRKKEIGTTELYNIVL